MCGGGGEGGGGTRGSKGSNCKSQTGVCVCVWGGGLGERGVSLRKKPLPLWEIFMNYNATDYIYCTRSFSFEFG